MGNSHFFAIIDMLRWFIPEYQEKNCFQVVCRNSLSCCMWGTSNTVWLFSSFLNVFNHRCQLGLYCSSLLLLCFRGRIGWNKFAYSNRRNTHFEIYLRWLLLEICVKFCIKNPSLAHRDGVNVEVKGQKRANHLKGVRNDGHDWNVYDSPWYLSTECVLLWALVLT